MHVDFVYTASVKKIGTVTGRATNSKGKKSTKHNLIYAGVKDPKFHSDHTGDAAASVLYWLIKSEVILPREEE